MSMQSQYRYREPVLPTAGMSSTELEDTESYGRDIGASDDEEDIITALERGGRTVPPSTSFVEPRVDRDRPGGGTGLSVSPSNGGVGRWFGVGARGNKSQVSFASSVEEGPGGRGTGERRKKLKKKKRHESSDGSGGYATAIPFARDSEDEAFGIGRRKRRDASGSGSGPSLASGSAIRLPPASAPASPTTERGSSAAGAVVELDQDWLGVVPFPQPSSTSASTTGNTRPHVPSSSSTSALPRLLRKASGSGSTGKKPPVSASSGASKRPLSLSSMLSRSTSTLPLSGGGSQSGGKRAPSPSPSLGIGLGLGNVGNKLVRSTSTSFRKEKAEKEKAEKEKAEKEKEKERPPSANSIRSPTISSMQKRRQSVDSANAAAAGTKQKESSSSFISRARAFSKSSSSTAKAAMAPPPSPIKATAPQANPTTTPTRTRAARRLSSGPPPRPPPAPPLSADARPLTTTTRKQPGLNQNWKMPRPISTASDASNASDATVRPAFPQSATAPAGPTKTIVPLCASLGRQLSASRKTRGARPPVAGAGAHVQHGSTRQQQGHRPSLSLNSIFDRSKSPLPSIAGTPPGTRRDRSPDPRPRTSMAVDRPASYYFDDAFEGGQEVVRRNSLSDLRIPTRITSSQARIEEDLARVREFAKGIDELKSLRRQYQQLIKIVVSPPSSPEPGSEPEAGPPPEAMQKMAQAIKRLEIDYRSWWEQAEALVDLGDGKQRVNESKDSPGTIASKRDRCVSLAMESPSKKETLASSDSEEEDLELDEGLRSSLTPRKPSMVRRVSSASSVATSVEDRQREMLRGVLTPPSKGASLPSRGPPAPRPSLGILEPSNRSSSAPTPSLPSSTPNAAPLLRQQRDIRRVSRAGVSGIKDFLLRLKLKSPEDGVGVPVPDIPRLEVPDQRASPRRSVSNPVRSETPAGDASRIPQRPRPLSGGSSSEEEDWDLQLTPDASPRSTIVSPSTPQAQMGMSGLGMRRSRTQSTTVGNETKMVLTTEAMPSLLLKVREVSERCSECIGRLKALTV
ncbi:hypothetical protein MNV49_005532 [Pseudohyphozyma bogoriensis]|nr:hypothetical protein MNV49_005532 [Pseudohyphozyma bogoriensis]